MDRNKAIDLIKSYVLGCLRYENESELKSLMEDAEKFPWRELGQYQNLVALIPVNLNLETPDSTAKERVTRMLNELKEAAKSEKEISQLQSGKSVMEQNDFKLEDVKLDDTFQLTDEQITFEDEPLPEIMEDFNQFKEYKDFSEKSEMASGEKILVEETHVPSSTVSEKPGRKTSLPVEEQRGGRKLKEKVDKDDFEKRTKEYINMYYQKKFEDLSEETQKALYIAITGFALAALAAILAIVM